jgi:hypothetical protein
VNQRLTRAVLGIAASFALQANAQINLGDIIVQPAAPRVNDTVRIVTAPSSSACNSFSINTSALTMVMSNNRITVTIPEQDGNCGTPPPLNTVHVSLGQFPPGDYEVEVVRMLEDQGGRLVSVGTRRFTVQPREPSAPLTNGTDIWWDPNESGWGLNVIQHSSNVIFATWFSYDDDGTPAWYVVPEGSWSSFAQSGRYANHLYTGPIYRTSGPVGGGFDPSRVSATRVGTAQLNFGQWDVLIATLTIDGRTIEKRLQRQSF